MAIEFEGCAKCDVTKSPKFLTVHLVNIRYTTHS